MTIEHSEKALELALAHIEKEFGKNSVMRIGDKSVEPWPAFSTGAFSLDLALGIGGVPKGRVIEIFGPESSGKTTLALSIIAEAHKAGEASAYIDAEHALDPTYARALGVDVDNLLIAQPDTGEEALTIVERLVKTGAFGVIVIDSVAALTPRAELEGDMGQSHVGLLARLMAQAMRKLSAIANETGTTLIFVNQIREKIGIMFGSPETTPGGRALKFYASVRIDIRKIEFIKSTDGEGPPGVRTKAKVIKNKMAPPFRIGEFDIIYGKGIDSIGSTIDIAVDKGLIDKRGAWYYHNGDQLGQGRANSILELSQDLGLVRDIQKQILAGPAEYVVEEAE